MHKALAPLIPVAPTTANKMLKKLCGVLSFMGARLNRDARTKAKRSEEEVRRSTAVTEIPMPYDGQICFAHGHVIVTFLPSTSLQSDCCKCIGKISYAASVLLQDVIRNKTFVCNLPNVISWPLL